MTKSRAVIVRLICILGNHNRQELNLIPGKYHPDVIAEVRRVIPGETFTSPTKMSSVDHDPSRVTRYEKDLYSRLAQHVSAFARICVHRREVSYRISPLYALQERTSFSLREAYAQLLHRELRGTTQARISAESSLLQPLLACCTLTEAAQEAHYCRRPKPDYPAAVRAPWRLGGLQQCHF